MYLPKIKDSKTNIYCFLYIISFHMGFWGLQILPESQSGNWVGCLMMAAELMSQILFWKIWKKFCDGKTEQHEQHTTTAPKKCNNLLANLCDMPVQSYIGPSFVGTNPGIEYAKTLPILQLAASRCWCGLPGVMMTRSLRVIPCPGCIRDWFKQKKW